MRIAAYNKSTSLTYERFSQLVSAIRRQMERDFYPIWGVKTEIYVPLSGTPRQGETSFVVLETRDQLQTLEFIPSAFIVMDEIASQGLAWSEEASKAVLRSAADIDVCEPVESHTYLIQRLRVSDFVYPSYYEGGGPPYDHLGVL